jgi:septal ring factor EnvC (AmiA/AmiB activator)
MRWNLLYRPLLRLLPAAVALLLCVSPAQGQTKKQLERDKAKIEKEIARLNGELAKARKNSKNSTKQITLIKSRIQERTRLIDNINGQMNILNRQIVRTEDSLRVVRGQIDSMKSEYAKVVRNLYGLRQNMNSAGLLFDNEQYNYSYLKMKYFAEYSRYRRHQETTIRRREQLFNDMSLDLQRQRREKTSLLAQERKQRDALSREQQRQQKSLNKSQQDEKSLQQQINKKEKQKQQLQQQIQQLISAEVAKSGSTGTGGGTGGGTKPSGTASGGGKTYSDAASADFVQHKGRLAWPVYYKSVAREYGIYTHSTGGQNRNYGIDLNCAPGATVSAVFDGTVASVFTTPTGAKGVIVRHGSYMTVYAGLGSVSVGKGSKVSTKQAIGTVAKGDEGTSEFSFQVWYGKDALNPRHWLR